MLHPVQSEEQTFVSVETAEEIILSHSRNYGSEPADLRNSFGRVLAGDIYSDTDFPPYDRVTMDGIAIQFSAFAQGIREFRIVAVQAAGDSFAGINSVNECIEIMTGASLPPTADTVIRYEDLSVVNNIATVTADNIRKGQNIHLKGEDSKKGEIVARSGQIISPAMVAVLASTGNVKISVRKLPSVLIVTTGNEIVEADQQPGLFEIRNSNRHVIASAMQQFGSVPSFMHLKDDENEIREKLKSALENYDVLVICGGVSKGKFDFIPHALRELGVKRLFHHVKQRPGKPFWFGLSHDKPVFAFPGNAMSVFLCLFRYLLPWLRKSTGVSVQNPSAILSEEVKFSPALQYFHPVKLDFSDGRLIATPVRTNGSGDFINLLQADAFIELPSGKNVFHKGESYRVWNYKNILNV